MAEMHLSVTAVRGRCYSLAMNSASDLHETTLDGPKTRRWLIEARECAEMSTHRIARLGMDEALPPYRRVRMSPGGSFVLACVSGEGSILLDGRWQRVKPGMVCLAPPRVLNAFEAKGREKWCFAWVRYDEPSFVTPVVGAASPVMPGAQAEEIARIINGLRAEWEGEKEPRMLHHWLELLHGTIRRIAQPWRSKEPRVAKLWADVEQDLRRDWTLAELAHRSHCSPEHLRRLCMRELGRSPMQHLTCLRMELARRLLEQENDKLEVVAACVGYANAAIFSRVFRRWVGVAPGEYRGRGA
jgi:AraC-like DNA-binding protein